MIYIITQGSYSDYNVQCILEGPDGSDMEDMKKQWANSYPINLNTANSESLVAWLQDQPGWSLVGYEEEHVGDYFETDYYVDYFREVRRQWGNPPKGADVQGCEVTRSSYGVGNHAFERIRTEEGAKKWKCSRCGEELTLRAG